MSTEDKPRIGAYRRHVLLCTGPRCSAQSDPEALFKQLGEMLGAAGLSDGELRVKRTRSGCFAACKGGPIMCVQPDGVWYYQLTPENLQRVVEEHLRDGAVVEPLVFHRGPGA